MEKIEEFLEQWEGLVEKRKGITKDLDLVREKISGLMGSSQTMDVGKYHITRFVMWSGNYLNKKSKEVVQIRVKK